MLQLFAVTYAPGDGPEHTFLLEAKNSHDVRNDVVVHLKEIGFDAINPVFDLRVLSISAPEGVTVLGSLGYRTDIPIRNIEVDEEAEADRQRALDVLVENDRERTPDGR